jgi:hypothetical protein
MLVRDSVGTMEKRIPKAAKVFVEYDEFGKTDAVGEIVRAGGPRSPTLNPAEEASKKEKCWAAGVFALNGTFYMANHYPQLVLQTNDNASGREALSRLQRFFGGSLKEYHGAWKWRMTGKRVNEFVDAISPFLGEIRKREILDKIALGCESATEAVYGNRA